jgi:hypothetical protein
MTVCSKEIVCPEFKSQKHFNKKKAKVSTYKKRGDKVEHWWLTPIIPAT